MRFRLDHLLATVAATFATAGLIAACSSDAKPGGAPSGDGGAAGATCKAPGAPTPGTADTHCNGKPAQTVSAASCTVPDAGTTDDKGDGGADAGDTSGGDDCQYGATMFGTSGKDDDCKYSVNYTAEPICEGTAGVQFTVTVATLADNKPVTGIPDGIDIEAFIPRTLNAACDTQTTHPSPSSQSLKETSTPGTYKGPVVFDAPGTWTVRFHIHEECADVLDDSPHGHAAFRINVP
jgi:hypothetical protein